MNNAGEAPARWLVVHDELLRGITHALSNRIATISASNYMFQNGDVQIDHITETLRVESERMEKLLQQLRLLPERPMAEAEPLTANDACAGAVQLHSYHSELGDYPCDVSVDADVYPIWAEPVSFSHALVMAINAAKRNAVNGSRVSLKVSGDVRVVNFRAESIPAPDTRDELIDVDAAAATWLLKRHGGSARGLDNGCEIEVPTLLAARRAQKGL
ncbi:MAG: hypothetical protein ABJB66_09345 [Gemmatimonadaceae bacterium]